MNIEQKINYQLNKYPFLKKIIKRLYQRGMYLVSNRIKSEGVINRITPLDEFEYFFGYYDKSPWRNDDRYMLCIRGKDTYKEVSPRNKADIIIIDTKQNNKIYVVGNTSSWNVQQGCMLQWLGPDFSDKIIYNDFRNGEYCSVILTLDINETSVSVTEEKIIESPVYSVSNDGKFALGLDFSRLYNLRPGYGYYNRPEITKGQEIPDTSAIYYVDLDTGEKKGVLSYKDLYNFDQRSEMVGATHKVNHIMISPNGKRFMVLHRWFKNNRKYTRLVTANVDGTDLYNLSDDDMVSHCYWKNDNEILAFENKHKGGPGYYLMVDKSNKYKRLWMEMINDGHPSYSYDGKLVVTDSYPNRARISDVKIMSSNENKDKITVIARVFSPFKYDNDTRCDLHPRWNRKSDKICIDSVFEGKRALYVVDFNRDEVL